MRRCLRDRDLVLLHEGDGRPANRDHLESCARCAGRYRQLAEDLGVISVVLAGDPVPVAVPRRVAWPRWALAGAVTVALLIGLNLLFAREWGRVARQSPAPVAGEGATTEELIAAVEALSAGQAPWLEAANAPARAAMVEASVAELYGAGELACESPAAWLEEGCVQVSAPGDVLGAGFTDLDS